MSRATPWKDDPRVIALTEESEREKARKPAKTEREALSRAIRANKRLGKMIAICREYEVREKVAASRARH
jgi:hypothetical protein